MKPYQKFETRPVKFLGVEEVAGNKLKVYSILYKGKSFNPELLTEALNVAADTLPEPNIEKGRPGVGFMILHQGNGADYLVLSWWDKGNELPTRIFVYENGWRRGKDDESFCVWDLELIWKEREAYVATMLSGLEKADIERYLNLFQNPHAIENTN